MTHLLLPLSAAVLIGVIAVQNYLYKPLQQESISAGLTGPYHWFLDGAFVLLSVAMFLAFRNASLIQHVLATAAAVSLLVTGASGTWTRSLGPNGEKIHAGFTAVTFVLALALQVVSNHTAAMWGITGLGITAALITHFLVANASVTEKVGVLSLCAWLVVV